MGYPSFFSLGLEDGHIPTFRLLLQPYVFLVTCMRLARRSASRVRSPARETPTPPRPERTRLPTQGAPSTSMDELAGMAKIGVVTEYPCDVAECCSRTKTCQRSTGRLIGLGSHASLGQKTT